MNEEILKELYNNGSQAFDLPDFESQMPQITDYIED